MKEQIEHLLDEWNNSGIEPHRLLEYDPGERYFLAKLYDEVSKTFSLTFKSDYYYDPAFGRNVYHTYSKVIASCLWLEDQADIIYETLCVKQQLCKKVSNVSVVDLSAVIFDGISWLGFPVLTLSVLLAKYGIHKICHCENGSPKKSSSNIFKPLTHFYLKDATAAQPSAHYEGFLRVALIYVSQNNYELARKRLKDCEAWLREEKSIKLPKKLKQELLDEYKDKKRDKIFDKKKLKWGKHLLATDFRSVGRHILNMALKEDSEGKLTTQQDKAVIFNEIGYAYVQIGDYNKARKLLNEALDILPKDSAALDSLGWLEYKEGKYTTAKKFFERSIKHDKKYHYETQYHLICTLTALGQYDKAFLIYDEIREKDPRNKWCLEAKKILPRSI